MIDLQPIKDRIEEASPGPWECSRERPDHTGDHVICEATFDVRRVASAGRWANALLIAHAPMDLKALVAEVERLRDAISSHRQVYVTERTKEWEIESSAALDEADRKLWSAIDA